MFFACKKPQDILFLIYLTLCLWTGDSFCSNDIEFRKYIHICHFLGKFLGIPKVTLQFLSPSTYFTFINFYFGEILPGLITQKFMMLLIAENKDNLYGTWADLLMYLSVHGLIFSQIEIYIEFKLLFKRSLQGYWWFLKIYAGYFLSMLEFCCRLLLS